MGGRCQPLQPNDHGQRNTKVKQEKRTYGEVIEGTSLLDVGESSLEILQLDVNLLRCLLSLGNLYREV